MAGVMEAVLLSPWTSSIAGMPAADKHLTNFPWAGVHLALASLLGLTPAQNLPVSSTGVWGQRSPRSRTQC